MRPAFAVLAVVVAMAVVVLMVLAPSYWLAFVLLYAWLSGRCLGGHMAGVATRTNVHWTARLVAVVAELSGEGLSDTAIAVVLRLYENVDGVTARSVRAVRSRHRIGKARAGKVTVPYVDPGQLRIESLALYRSTDREQQG